jgi:hypothetical protein
MQTMLWINKHKNAIRVAESVLLLVAIMGPWVYSSDGVPPAAWCRDPYILLENDRCVGLVLGVTIITFMAGAFISMSVGLVSSATLLPDRTREFLLSMVLPFLLILPFFTTLLLIRGRDSRRLQVFHMLAWGLAALSTLPLLMSASALPPVQLWGIWLYIGVAASALVLELLALLTC